MNILVITFSRGLNPGTFMQAYGVKQGMIDLFPEASIEYLNFPDFKWNTGNRGKKDSIWHIFKQKLFALYRLRKYRLLENAVFNYTKRIDLLDYDLNAAKRLLEKYDLVVVGSDTILEVAENSQKTQISLNWFSSQLCKAKHIFFAASASPAKYSEDSVLMDKLSLIARNFLFFGLRDKLTINLFVDKLKFDLKQLVQQPDPSYLLDANEFHLSLYYKRKLLKLKEKGCKIVFYNFSPNFPYRKELADKLRNVGYKVITSVYNPYADLCVDTIDAKEWAGMFKFCDLVVTERFHDSLFALRNGCPVIAVDWESHRISNSGDSKTYRILQDYELESFHVVFTSEEHLNTIVEKSVAIMNSFDREKVLNIAASYEANAHQILKGLKDILV